MKNLLRPAVGLAALLAMLAPPPAGAAHAPAVDRDTVVMATAKDFDSLDASVVSTASAIRFAWQIYDSLYGFDNAGNLVPRLAESYVISPDQLQYRFTLRPGVKFHDGETLTSADIRYSMERVLDPATKSTHRVNFAPIIDGIETPDDRTVVFRLKEPNGAFLNMLTGYLFIVPKKYTEALPGPEAFGRQPIGTGPYKFADLEIGQRLVLERFDGYFGAKPKVKRIVFKHIPEPTSRVNALLTGEADAADILPSSEIARLEKTEGIDVMPTPTGGPLGVKLYANDPESPLYKKDVRLALNYAIDAEAIVKTVLHGAGKPIATFISSFYPYGVDHDLKPLGYHPDLARALLKKAGYPNGFEITLISGNDMPKELSVAIAAYWTAVGVKTKLNIMDYVAWIRVHNVHKSGPATVMQFTNAIYDPIHVFYNSAAKDGMWSDYYNADAEALIQQSLTTANRDERDKIFKQLGRVLRDDAYTVPITELYIVYGKNADLDWHPQPGATWYNLRDWGWK